MRGEVKRRVVRVRWALTVSLEDFHDRTHAQLKVVAVQLRRFHRGLGHNIRNAAMIIEEFQLSHNLAIGELADVQHAPVLVPAPDLHSAIQNDVHPLWLFPKPDDVVPWGKGGLLEAVREGQQGRGTHGLKELHVAQQAAVQRAAAGGDPGGQSLVHLPSQHVGLAWGLRGELEGLHHCVHQVLLPQHLHGSRSGLHHSPGAPRGVQHPLNHQKHPRVVRAPLHHHSALGVVLRGHALDKAVELLVIKTHKEQFLGDDSLNQSVILRGLGMLLQLHVRRILLGNLHKGGQGHPAGAGGVQGSSAVGHGPGSAPGERQRRGRGLHGSGEPRAELRWGVLGGRRAHRQPRQEIVHLRALLKVEAPVVLVDVTLGVLAQQLRHGAHVELEVAAAERGGTDPGHCHDVRGTTMVVEELQVPDGIPPAKLAHAQHPTLGVPAPHFHCAVDDDVHVGGILAKPQDPLARLEGHRHQAILQLHQVVVTQGLQKFQAPKELPVELPLLDVLPHHDPLVKVSVEDPAAGVLHGLHSGTADAGVHQLQLPEVPPGPKRGHELALLQHVHLPRGDDVQRLVLLPLVQDPLALLEGPRPHGLRQHP
eukprot:RCo012594